MNKINKLLFLASMAVIFLINPSVWGDENVPVIGIFGDVHGDHKVASEVLEQMRKVGVTHIIGTGDFVGREAIRRIRSAGIDMFELEQSGKFVDFGGAEDLEKIISIITPITNVPRENIFLFPGNWEHNIGHDPKKMNDVLRKYGNLVFDKYDSYGFVKIGESRIMVSHFPQHTIPEELLPPADFRRRTRNQIFVMDTIERGIFPDSGVAFEIIAHTHIGGSFVDKSSGKMVINAGVLDSFAKSSLEPRAFAIFDGRTQKINYISIDTKEIIATTSIEDPVPLLLLPPSKRDCDLLMK